MDLDLTTDKGMASALNLAWKDYEQDGDGEVARTRSSLVGRGIAIRNLRLREAQFAEDKKRRGRK